MLPLKGEAMRERFKKEGPARWLGFVLLGVAGVLVSIAGIYELTRGSTPTAEPATEPVAITSSNDELQRLRAENLRLKLDAIRRARAAAADKPQEPGRCVGGVLFREVDGELRNIGRC